MEANKLTYGERAVGASFNPSGDPVVAELKKLAADFIDECQRIRENSSDSEVA